MLLRLYPTRHVFDTPLTLPSTKPDAIQTTAPVSIKNFTFREANVLMLDYAQFKLNKEDWSSPTEVLRIDNILRSRLNIPRKGMAWKQPWAVPTSDRKPLGAVKLRFTFHSDITMEEDDEGYGNFSLALEEPETMNITINGDPYPQDLVTLFCEDKTKAYWVDESIRRLPLPNNSITRGENTIELSFPFGILTNIERIYLLGHFGVNLSGPNERPRVTPLVGSNLTWGDMTNQLLPFYAGNLTYKVSFTVPDVSSSQESKKSNVTLRVPNFSSPVLTVHDEKSKKLGTIALQPRSLELGQYAPGKHTIQITAFGNRYNSFGHIHLRDGITNQCWPDIWRSECSSFLLVQFSLFW